MAASCRTSCMNVCAPSGGPSSASRRPSRLTTAAPVPVASSTPHERHVVQVRRRGALRVRRIAADERRDEEVPISYPQLLSMTK